ncbi:MAG: hypothetical protein CL811_00425 [Colwelliaceae bacterium]|nr:hypothetical protein [Colwelliaceae bacterium]
MAKVSWLKVFCLISCLLNAALVWFLCNLLRFDATRVDLYQYLAKQFGSVEVVLTGDSLTRRNSDLAWKAAGLALNVRNVAKDGDDIYQITAQIDRALAVEPKVVTIMAGTNRVKDMSADETFRLFQQAVWRVMESGTKPILIEAPMTNRADLNKYLSSLNALLFKFAIENKLPFFKTNEALGIEQELRAPYTVDGVHLTPLAYEQLNKKLIPFIQSHLKMANNKN